MKTGNEQGKVDEMPEGIESELTAEHRISEGDASEIRQFSKSAYGQTSKVNQTAKQSVENKQRRV